MVPRQYRMRNPLLIQKAFRFGKPFFFGNLGCRILFRSVSGKKIAYITPKKVFRLATERNRARRILSEALTAQIGRFPQDAQAVVFFRGKPDPARDSESVQRDVEGILRLITGQDNGKSAV